MTESALRWLPTTPSDFRALCASVDEFAGDRGSRLRQLANADLGPNQLHRLAKSVERAVAQARVWPLDAVKLAMVSNATTDLLVAPIVGASPRYGLALQAVAAPYGITLQAALDPTSNINQLKPDIILIALDYRAFFAAFSLDDHERQLRDAKSELSEIVAAFRRTSKAALLIQTLASPPERLFGNLDQQQPGTLSRLNGHFNEWLATEIAGPGLVLLDVASLAANVGALQWFDPGQWFVAKLPFSQRFVPVYADLVTRAIAAVRGKSKKVLVLDLDNTIWGGIIGDDGIDGVKLGQGDPAGEAFVELQKAALALKNRGILLAVCSKNDEAVALEALRNHPDMVFSEGDFSAFQINWSDKASNLEVLAKRLSLGLDSFVFLDDNPFEREQVRQALPSVTVPELPSDPTSYARLLMTSGLFESISFSEEDRERSAQYAANAQRESLLTTSRDLNEYLRSLEMKARFTSTGANGWQRFTQLINKSNQFNLTTKRYSESEVLELVSDPKALALQVRLVDRFGDNGMISSIICRPNGDDWVIDTWVMSCRVLGRTVEEAVLNHLVERAIAANIATIRGVYRPTGRNDMVAGHYNRLGFREDSSEGTETRWTLRVNEFKPFGTQIAVEVEK